MLHTAVVQMLCRISMTAEELLGTILLEQSEKSGRITVKQVIEGSTAANVGPYMCPDTSHCFLLEQPF